VSADLRVTVAGLELKNPVIAGSGEATASAEGIRACLAAGAAAVVAKSTNESTAAHAQLRAAEYVLLDEELRARPLGPASRTDSLFCRSGILDVDLDEWAETLAALDREAAAQDAYVVPSVIVADVDAAVAAARRFADAGQRRLELNVAAPHAPEADGAAIRTGVELVAPVRRAVEVPLTVKVGAAATVGPAAAAGADAVCLVTRSMGFVPDLETRRPVLGTFAAVGGAWALPVSLHAVAKARAAHPDVPLVGTNGARSGLDVARFLLAGASAVAMTTAVLTDGPGALARALAELDAYCTGHDCTAADLVGEAADHVKTYEEVAIERRH
jgi:dihydroorotate dehydrogenase